MQHSLERNTKFGPQDQTFLDRPNPSLVTVFASKDTLVMTEQWVKQKLRNYQYMDVFDTAFLQRVVLLGFSEIDKNAHALLKREGMQWVHTIGNSASETKLPPGPYVLLEGYLRKVYQVYTDFNSAFFCPLEFDGERFLAFVNDLLRA